MESGDFIDISQEGGEGGEGERWRGGRGGEGNNTLGVQIPPSLLTTT